MKQPHKHAALIKAWADGAEIELYNFGRWQDVKTPSWCLDLEYRIKPEPDQISYLLLHYADFGHSVLFF